MDSLFHFFSNQNADPYRDTYNALLLDDEAELNQVLCLSIIEEYPELLVVGGTDPEKALKLIDEIYFDVIITDINMPKCKGDVVIETMRRRSPTTYVMTMTGHSMDAAFLAGKAQPDFFLDKSQGFQSLLKGVSKGLQECLERQKEVLAYCDPEMPIEELTAELHWRKRKKVIRALGFRPKEIALSRNLLKAYSLVSNPKEMTRQEIAYCAGFSSFQRMHEQLASKMSDYFPISSVF